MFRKPLRRFPGVISRRSNPDSQRCVQSLKIPSFPPHFPEKCQNFRSHSHYFLTFRPSSLSMFLVREKGAWQQSP